MSSLIQESRLTKSVKILGIDPGLGIVGFGLLQVQPDGQFIPHHWGVITTSKDKPESARLQELYTDITGLIQQFQPDEAAVERIFFFKNSKTLVPVSQARGIILLAMENAGIPIFEYTPMQAKQALTGSGKADKREIQIMVTQILGLEKMPKPDDAADALAMAVCHSHFRRGL